MVADVSYEIALRWMPLDLTDDKSTLIQVMVWCRQATSHYLSQCWPRSVSPNGITRPQWVNLHLCWNDWNTELFSILTRGKGDPFAPLGQVVKHSPPCSPADIEHLSSCDLVCVSSVGEKLSWFIRHLSDGLYIFYINLGNFPSDIWA